jgi:hypothetical protein
MALIAPRLCESTREEALFGARAFDTMERPPKWSRKDPSRLLESVRELVEPEHAPDKRRILFVGSLTSSPARLGYASRPVAVDQR